jgi:hypothetical protein
MTSKAIFSGLILAVAMIVAAPTKADAQVVVAVRIGPVVPRPAYVVVHPRPYPYAYYPHPYAYDRRPVVVAPVIVPRAAGYYYRGRWYPRPYAYRGYVGPRHFRR